jgi:2-polyprenyl-6-hydroxyphenyl methylase/3-demethylubiquinone-9 3-methyltransferase
VTDARNSVVAGSSEDAAVAFHDSLARSWQGKYQKESFRRRTELLSEMLCDLKLSDSSWLDAGCGTGTLSRWLAQSNCCVLAVDGSAEMIRVARSALDLTQRIEYRTVDTIAKLPVPDGSLDGVLCSSVLEYVLDPKACVVEFRRMLRPSGVLIVSVPNSRSAVRKFLQFGHWASKVVGWSWMPYLDHSRHEYSADGFARMLADTGFGHIRSAGFGAGLPKIIGSASWAAPLLMFRAHRMERE